MPKQSTRRTLAVAIVATSAALIAPVPAAAGGGRLVPVHVSPPPNGGILVTHGNLHLPPPPAPVNIVRDHRPGGLHIGCGHHPTACAQGGVFGGAPAPPRGVQGGTVRDHRH